MLYCGNLDELGGFRLHVGRNRKRKRMRRRINDSIASVVCVSRGVTALAILFSLSIHLVPLNCFVMDQKMSFRGHLAALVLPTSPSESSISMWNARHERRARRIFSVSGNQRQMFRMSSIADDNIDNDGTFQNTTIAVESNDQEDDRSSIQTITKNADELSLVGSMMGSTIALSFPTSSDCPPQLYYRSKIFENSPTDWSDFLQSMQDRYANGETWVDPFWEQIRQEAFATLDDEPEAGPQLYQCVLSQPDFVRAICTIVSHEIETELIPAIALKNLFLELLEPRPKIVDCIRLDLQAVATRSSGIGRAMDAMLFHNGFHALVCYRVGHLLWQANRTALAYYLQSTVSRKYSADIHPSCELGSGLYLRVGCGVVIGETARVGDDVSILEGVTLGGTGKESGDRHPKVGNGVILHEGGTILGNIPVGDGVIITARSLVNKPIPPLAIVSGVPGRVLEYRRLEEDAFEDDTLQQHLALKYMLPWKILEKERLQEEKERLENVGR